MHQMGFGVLDLSHYSRKKNKFTQPPVTAVAPNINARVQRPKATKTVVKYKMQHYCLLGSVDGIQCLKPED